MGTILLVHSFKHSLWKHMVSKQYYKFRYLTNLLKIRSRDLTVHNTGMLIKFSKEIATSFPKIVNG